MTVNLKQVLHFGQLYILTFFVVYSKILKSSMANSEESDLLRITPLGAGQEVGRSCIFIEFKGKKILLDLGIHPGYTGLDSLPFIDEIDPEEVDLLLISHFHLDHCGTFY